MSQHQIIQEWEDSQTKKDIPTFNVGDTINVHIRIIEGGKERIQVFNGIVMTRKGRGLAETFSVYRNAYGSSMERVFPLHSPRIAKIEVARRGKVRRAKLYYLRGKTGKKAKVEDLIVANPKKNKKAEAASKKTAKADVDEHVADTEKPAVSEE